MNTGNQFLGHLFTSMIQSDLKGGGGQGAQQGGGGKLLGGEQAPVAPPLDPPLVRRNHRHSSQFATPRRMAPVPRLWDQYFLEIFFLPSLKR